MIAAALLAATVASGCGLPPLAAGPRPFRTGETLAFDLDLLGMVKAGTLELSVERPLSGGKVVPLRARARTTAQISSLKKLTAVGLSWVEATVAAGVEPVETPAGKFDTFRVDLAAHRADTGGKVYELHLWFSNDTRRLLVAAVAELDVGPARVTLTTVRGGR